MRGTKYFIMSIKMYVAKRRNAGLEVNFSIVVSKNKCQFQKLNKER